jgi:hypothetical protein
MCEYYRQSLLLLASTTGPEFVAAGDFVKTDETTQRLSRVSKYQIAPVARSERI